MVSRKFCQINLLYYVIPTFYSNEIWILNQLISRKFCWKILRINLFVLISCAISRKKKFLRKNEIASSNSLYLCQILMSCLKYIFSYKATRSLLLRHAKLHIVFEATTLKLPSVGQWIHISSGPIRKFFWFKTILLVNGGILINQKFW